MFIIIAIIIFIFYYFFIIFIYYYYYGLGKVKSHTSVDITDLFQL